MADPITIGIMALQAGAEVAKGISEKKQAKAEARALDENALQTELQGNEDALYSLRQSRMEDGASLVGSAAGGVNAGSGSLGDIMRVNAKARWDQVFNLQQVAAVEAGNYRTQAKQARKRGKAALIGGLVRAGASALSSYSAARNGSAQGAANSAARASDRQGPAPLGRIPLPGGRATVGG